MSKIAGSQNGSAFHGDAGALAEELRGKIRGEVRFDSGSRALYAADGSNYREVPIGVVMPSDAEDVTQTILTANRHGAPVLSQPELCARDVALRGRRPLPTRIRRHHVPQLQGHARGGTRDAEACASAF